SASGDNFFDATHGGAALLEFPQILKRGGASAHYENVGINPPTRGGPPPLAPPPPARPRGHGPHPKQCPFRFAPAAPFSLRPIPYEPPLEGFVSDRQFEYDPPDGRPVLRSAVWTIPAQRRTIRLDVEECRFGPIPEAEFALEPFLAGLGPVRPNWQPAAEPS